MTCCINVRMNPHIRKSISSLLRNKLFDSNQTIYRRYLNTKCDTFTRSTCYTITRSSNQQIPLYSASWLCQINSTGNVIHNLRTYKKNVPLDPVCKQPVMHEEKGHLVYVGVLANNVKNAKGFAFFNSVLAIFFQPFMINALNVSNQFQNPLVLSLYGSLMFAIVVGMPAAFHLMAKRYVLYLYFNEETNVFTATTLGFFMQRKDIVFKAEDVRIPKSAGPFSHIEVRGRPLFINPPAFRSQDVYIHMMGYDKPIELKFEHHMKEKK